MTSRHAMPVDRNLGFRSAFKDLIHFPAASEIQYSEKTTINTRPTWSSIKSTNSYTTAVRIET
jgi:hypothetical protein